MQQQHVSFRSYQTEADLAIAAELQHAEKCLVKMFCGTGKSRLMRWCQSVQHQPLVAFVFPSLVLVDQFSKDYLLGQTVLRICSELEATTDYAVISTFLQNESLFKFVCVTYQSLHVLVRVLQDLNMTLDVCVFDEAHHAVGEVYQQHIFRCTYATKQIFFTATPKNANGIIMYDWDGEELGNPLTILDCGKKVVDYSYLRGVEDGYLTPFDLRLDVGIEGNQGTLDLDPLPSSLQHTSLAKEPTVSRSDPSLFTTGNVFCEEEGPREPRFPSMTGTNNNNNNTRSAFESIARAILATGNSRVLTFHAFVDTDSDTAVNRFVNESEFRAAFRHVQATEFPLLSHKYSQITMVKLTANQHQHGHESRSHLLAALDACSDDAVYVLCSCRTISEGVDTKRANMVVFVDPKTSLGDIIQIIGRSSRRVMQNEEVERWEEVRHATVLVLAYIDRERYLAVQDDAEACDRALREDVQVNGKFGSLLNVVSALRQEDPELVELCLQYPHTFSPGELRRNLQRHGYDVVDVREVVADQEEEDDDDNDDCGDTLFRSAEMVLSDKELDWDEFVERESDETWLQTIADTHQVHIDVHTNSLQHPVVSYCPSFSFEENEEEEEEEDEEEVEDEDKDAMVICKEGLLQGTVGCSLSTPRVVSLLQQQTHTELDDVVGYSAVHYQPIVSATTGTIATKHITPPNSSRRSQLTFASNDDVKVLWKLIGDTSALIGSCIMECQVTRVDPVAAMEALIVRGERRVENGGRLLPRNLSNPKNDEERQESKDADKLKRLRQAKCGKHGRWYPKVGELLDARMPGWDKLIDLEQACLDEVIAICNRGIQRVENGGRLLPRIFSKPKNDEERQESKDAYKLKTLRQTKHGKKTSSVWYPKVGELLDACMPGWDDVRDLEQACLDKVVAICNRGKQRVENGGRLLPRRLSNTQTNKEERQESKDATKLEALRRAKHGKKTTKIWYPKVGELLDVHMPGWDDVRDLEQACLDEVVAICNRGKQRVENGGRLLPRSLRKTKNNKEEQEKKDASKLEALRQAKCKKNATCVWYPKVGELLDARMPGWDKLIDLEQACLDEVVAICDRGDLRVANGGRLQPLLLSKPRNNKEEQEKKDAQKLETLRRAKHGVKTTYVWYPKVGELLDARMPGWDKFIDLEQACLDEVIAICERGKKRVENGGRLLPRSLRKPKNNKEEQEKKDARKLETLRKAKRGKKTNCVWYPKVGELLDARMPGWNENKIKTVSSKKRSTTLALAPPSFTSTETSSEEDSSFLSLALATSLSTPMDGSFVCSAKDTVKKGGLQGTVGSLDEPNHKRQRIHNQHSVLLGKYKTMTPAHVHTQFATAPQTWYEYHTLAQEQEEHYDPHNVPRNILVRHLQSLRHAGVKVVVDMGCGLAQISAHFSGQSMYNFVNLDHVAANDSVVACDMSVVPLPSHSASYCILCLSLWGPRPACLQYLCEAARVLESGGTLFLAEATKRWSDVDEQERVLDGTQGVHLEALLREAGFTIANRLTDATNCTFVVWACVHAYSSC